VFLLVQISSPLLAKRHSVTREVQALSFETFIKLNRLKDVLKLISEYVMPKKKVWIKSPTAENFNYFGEKERKRIPSVAILTFETKVINLRVATQKWFDFHRWCVAIISFNKLKFSLKKAYFTTRFCAGMLI